MAITEMPVTQATPTILSVTVTCGAETCENRSFVCRFVNARRGEFVCEAFLDACTGQPTMLHTKGSRTLRCNACLENAR